MFGNITLRKSPALGTGKDPWAQAHRTAQPVVLADRSPLDGRLSGYITESLTMDHSG